MTEKELNKIINEALYKNNPEKIKNDFYDSCCRELEKNIENYCLYMLYIDGYISKSDYEKLTRK